MANANVMLEASSSLQYMSNRYLPGTVSDPISCGPSGSPQFVPVPMPSGRPGGNVRTPAGNVASIAHAAYPSPAVHQTTGRLALDTETTRLDGGEASNAN